MKGQRVVHSSKSDEWATPDALYKWLNQRFLFTTDAAATKENTKAKRFFTKENSALDNSWGSITREVQSVWTNPPYSLVTEFTKKAAEEIKKGVESIVFLVPARTDTRWFHLACETATTIYLIEGRIKFVGAGNSAAPFPSCLIVWGTDNISNRVRDDGLEITPLSMTKTLRGF